MRLVVASVIATLVPLICVILDVALLDFVFLTPYRGIPPLEPLYAFWLPAISWRLIVPTGLAVILLASIGRLRSAGLGYRIVLLFVAMVALRASFAFLRHPFGAMGSELMVYPGEETLYDAARVREMGVWRFVDEYPDLMPSLSIHGRHFPPGFALTFYGLIGLWGPSVAGVGWSLVLLSSTVVIPLLLIAERTIGRDGSLAAGLLSLLFPSSVVYGAVSASALFAALAVWPFVFLVHGLLGAKARSMWLCGLTLGLCMFFSFSTFPLGLLVLLTVLLYVPKTGYLSAISSLVHIGLGFLLFTVTLQLLSGFDLYACFLMAHKLNFEAMSEVVMRPVAELWAYATWGNYVAFLVGIGGAVLGPAVLFLSRHWRIWGRDANVVTALGWAWVATLGFVGSARIYLMETERIWLFLAMFLVFPAAAYLVEDEAPSRLVANLRLVGILLFMQTAAYETLLYTLW